MLMSNPIQCFVDVGNSTRESLPSVEDAARPSTVEKNVRAPRGVKVTDSGAARGIRMKMEVIGNEKDIIDPINFRLICKLWTKLVKFGLFLMGTMRSRMGSALALVLLKFRRERRERRGERGKGRGG
jgi:hypothetical protein